MSKTKILCYLTFAGAILKVATDLLTNFSLATLATDVPYLLTSAGALGGVAMRTAIQKVITLLQNVTNLKV